MARKTNSRRKGFGYIEVLVSMLILVVSILAALSLYGFSMNMIDRTGDQAIAYNLERKALENARQGGFDYTIQPDGTTTKYYDIAGANPSNTQVVGGANPSVFKVVVVISTDIKDGAGHPAPDAIRTVTVNVTRVSNNQNLEQAWTMLVRSGV